MKKLILILGLFPISLFAQLVEVPLQEVVLSDNRFETTIKEAGMNVVVITQAQIKAMPVRNVQELLQFVAGIDLRQRGPGGTQADVGVRGGTFDQTLVLWNGIKMTDPQTGHHTLNLGLDINFIQRVEIIKGPAAARYGMNAHSGVINIITTPPSEWIVSKGIAISTDPSSSPSDTFYAGYDSWFGAGFRTGKATHFGSIQQLRSTGHRPNTDQARNTMLWQSVIPTKIGKFSAQASWLNNYFGASGFYAFPSDSNSEEKVRTWNVGLQHETTWKKWTFRTKGYYRHNTDTYTFVRQNPTFFQNRHLNQVAGGEFHATLPYSNGILGLGYEYRSENINSNNLGQRQRQIHGVFAENRWKSENARWIVNTSAYLNFAEIWGIRLFPSADINYKVKAGFHAFARYSESMRAPTFTDLYYQSRTNIGNPNLTPEYAQQAEAGVKWFHQKHSFQGSLFYTRSSDMIDWTRDSLTQPWQASNYEKVKGLGADLLYQWRIQWALFPWLKIHDLGLGYQFLDLNLASEGQKISRYALSHLNHQIVFQGTVLLMKHMKFMANVRYADRITGSSYWLIDTRFTYATELAKLFVDATNFTNVRYVEAGNALMPGRWIRVGFQMDLKKSTGKDE